MKILIAGDYCDRYRITEEISKGNYNSMFGMIRDYVRNTDFSFVNFEFPIVVGNSKPIKKCGPNLRGQLKSIDAIKWVGFNCCTLANNHTLDYDEESLIYTREQLLHANINVVGAGENLTEASKILYLKKYNETLAVINCCEHEFSIATDNTAGTCPLNPIQQFYKIKEARENADYVLIIVHGGHEHFQLPSLRMKEIYRFFIDAGADAVVNHHQHCYSGYEIYNGKPIFFGLGNLLFDNERQRNSIWNEGFMTVIQFNEKNIGFELIPYKQCNEEPRVELMNEEQQKLFFNKIKELNDIISDNNKLKREIEKYYASCIKAELSYFEPYRGRILRKLHYIGILPSFVTGSKIPSILNHIECEAHRDKLIHTLHKKLN